ncbi:MAG: hypothetical protein FVQ82_13545 [Planctomycetes bacterium]|nr:hypothetical protein [Planctomycetota bacterium]
MSIKEKRKKRKDYSIYSDRSDMALRKSRPNLYKMPAEREKLDRYLFSLSKKSDNYRKEMRIKGLKKRISEEIALTSWL